MKRPESHRIQEEAELLFQSSLPRGWVKQAQSPDYGIDYHVEIWVNDKFTGSRFGAQVKGVTGKALTSANPRFGMETDHLDHYLKHRMPVYLFAIHVHKRIGYWVFLQEYVLKELRGKNWRSQKTIMVYFPAANLLSDTKRLQHSVVEADNFMSRMHPASIQSAITSSRERMESADPRFRVEILATEGRTQCILHAKEPVSIQMLLHGAGETIKRKMEDLIGRGLPVQFSANEIEFSGTPLLQEVLTEDLTVQFSKTLYGTMDILALDDSHNLKSQLNAIPAVVSGGTSEYRITATLPDSPLGLAITGAIAAPPSTVPHSLGLKFDPMAWAGQPVRRLAYFDQIFSLFSPPDTSCFQTVLMCKGNQVAGGVTHKVSSEDLEHIRNYLHLLSKARYVAAKFQIDPVCPSIWSEDDVASVMELHGFLERIGKTVSCSNARIKTGIVPRDIDQLVNSTKDNKDGSLKLEAEARTFSFLGKEVNIGRHEYIFSRLRVATTEEDLRRSFRESSGTEAQVEWVGTESSTMELRLLD